MSIWTAALLLCFALLPNGASAFECNNLKRFRCKKGGAAQANGCTWVKDKFKAYQHFSAKKRLFGICLNAGQSESEFFGTPAERCDCGIKCMRKCKKGQSKKNCYWAGPRLTGTCLPTSHFAATAPAGSCTYEVTDANFKTTVQQYIDNVTNATAILGDISCMRTSEVTDMESAFRDATTFNGDISNFDTSKVTLMLNMFRGASDFGGDYSTGGQDISGKDISNWDTSKVTNFANMFKYGATFNGDLSKWDTSSSTGHNGMFTSAAVFQCSLHLPAGVTAQETSCNN